jgi:Flp pilus assembly pilin Flp
VVIREPVRAVRRAVADESGSAMIEAALVIPVVLVIVFGVVMTGRVVHAQIAVQEVAREAGRTLASAGSAPTGLEEARSRGLAVAGGHGLSAGQLELVLDLGAFERGGTVRAQASYTVGLGDLPLLGQFEVTVSSSHQERIELYRSRTAALP